MTSTWSAAALRAAASSNFNATVSDAELDRTVALWRRLGTLEELGHAVRTTRASAGFGSYKNGVSTEYRYASKFSNGPATIAVELVLQNGSWKVQKMTIQSRLFQ